MNHKTSFSSIRPVSNLAPAATSYTYSAPKMLPVGSLPQFWTIECDRFVCRLDAEDVPLSRIVALVKKEFQPLKLVTLTPGMVDKRLRMLDQDVSIDYWKDGLSEEGNEMMPSNEGKAKVQELDSEDVQKMMASAGLRIREDNERTLPSRKMGQVSLQ